MAAEIDRVVLNGWQILRIFATGVTVLGPFFGSRFIAKGSPDWRRAFGAASELPLSLEQRATAARLGLFYDAHGRQINPPTDSASPAAAGVPGAA